MPKEKRVLPSPSSEEKLPPHSTEAEENVIGSIILQPIITNLSEKYDIEEDTQRGSREVYESVSSIITEEDFVDPLNKIIFRSFGQIDEINTVTVTNWITGSQEWSNYGNKIQSHLLHCSGLSPTNIAAEHYADEIKRLSLMRRLIEIAGNLSTHAYNGRMQIPDIVNYTINQLEQASRDCLLSNKRALITNIKILKSSPRSYEMYVNGNYIKCDAETLLSRKDFKSLLLNKLDFIPILPSKENWDKYINSLLDLATKEETPVETSPEYELKEDIQGWLDEIPLAEDYKDLKIGAYVTKKIEGKIYMLFQVTPLLKYLRFRKYALSISKLWASMKSWGAIKHETRVGDIPCKLWALPEDFTENTTTLLHGNLPDWF